MMQEHSTAIEGVGSKGCETAIPGDNKKCRL
jgi:hypothetical protein